MSTAKPRVGIVIERYDSPGGIQTCLIELVTGLNEIGIVPDIVWDQPQNWEALGDPDVQAGFGGGRLGIPSTRLRSLPFWLGGRLRLLSFRLARLDLTRYDFLYSYELEIKMPRGVPNVCSLSGPSHLRMPGDRVNWRRFYAPAEIGKLASLVTSPLVGPDRNAHYVTHSDWIADLFESRYGDRPYVIWPPVRSRLLPPAPPDRSGFLFLSRLVDVKRADVMIKLATAFPKQRVTVAGAMIPPDRPFVDRLRTLAADRDLTNVTLVPNPSEQELAKLFTSHEYFVFPALWEHFGIVTVEAVQAGLLPLVHDSGGQREIVPIRSLRFGSDEELIEQARNAMKMASSEREEIIEGLRARALRSAPERYREEMLRPLVQLGEWVSIDDTDGRSFTQPLG